MGADPNAGSSTPVTALVVVDAGPAGAVEVPGGLPRLSPVLMRDPPGACRMAGGIFWAATCVRGN